MVALLLRDLKDLRMVAARRVSAAMPCHSERPSVIPKRSEESPPFA